MSNVKRDERVVVLHDHGLSAREIALQLGLSQSVVRVALYRAHRLADHSRDHLGAHFNDVVEAWENGASIQQLADLAGKTHNSMKWIVIIMRAYGHLTDRERVPANKGKHMPMRKKHQDIFDKLVAVPGWEKMKRGELATALKIPTYVFIGYWRTFRNRGLVGPKSQGKTAGSAADVRAASRRLTNGSDKTQNLWAAALGRRTV